MPDNSDGSNGSNGNGQNEFGELVQWINPEKLEYKSTDRQKAFRRLARRMADNGDVFKKQWYRSSGKSESANLKDHAVTPSEWKRWCKDSRFIGWFYEDFPEAEPVSEEELCLLDNVWWRGVYDGMRNGESWAFDRYSKVRFAKTEQAQTSADLKELRDYLGGDSSGNNWRLPSAEA